MIPVMLPLVGAWLPLWEEYIVPIFALCFIAFVGSFIHFIFRRD